MPGTTPVIHERIQITVQAELPQTKKKSWNGRFVHYFSRHKCQDTSISAITKLFLLTTMACAGFFASTLFFDPSTNLNNKTRHTLITILTCSGGLIIASVALEVFRCIKCIHMRSLVPSAFLLAGVEFIGGDFALIPLLNTATQMRTNYYYNQSLIYDDEIGMNLTCQNTFAYDYSATAPITAPNCWECGENNWYTPPSTSGISYSTQLRIVPVSNLTICTSSISSTLNELPDNFNVFVNKSSIPQIWPCEVPQWSIITTNPEGFNALHESLAKHNLHPPADLKFTETNSTNGQKCWVISGTATNYFSPAQQCLRNSTWLPNPKTYNPCLSDYALKVLNGLIQEAAELNKTALPYPERAITLINLNFDPYILTGILLFGIGILHEGIDYKFNQRRKTKNEKAPLLINQS